MQVRGEEMWGDREEGQREGERDRHTESNSFLKPGPELGKEDDKDLP